MRTWSVKHTIEPAGQFHGFVILLFVHVLLCHWPQQWKRRWFRHRASCDTKLKWETPQKQGNNTIIIIYLFLTKSFRSPLSRLRQVPFCGSFFFFSLLRLAWNQSCANKCAVRWSVSHSSTNGFSNHQTSGAVIWGMCCLGRRREGVCSNGNDTHMTTQEKRMRKVVE